MTKTLTGHFIRYTCQLITTWRMASLLWADRKTTVTQIITRHNRGIIAEEHLWLQIDYKQQKTTIGTIDIKQKLTKIDNHLINFVLMTKSKFSVKHEHESTAPSCLV